MIPSTPNKTKLLLNLTPRLVTLGIFGVVFCEALNLSQGKAQGWTFYLTSSEVAFEVWVRLVFAALVGIPLGIFCALIAAPFVALSDSPEKASSHAKQIAVFLMLFVLSRYAVQALIEWWYGVSAHRAIYDKLLLAAQVLIFVVALVVPRLRRKLTSSLDDALTPKMTRRTVLTTIVGTAALVGTEYVLSKRLPHRSQVTVKERPKSNFLLITFDALCAEDLSLYGSKLATSPNIDRFAGKSTVFTRFYSASTFTTPTVATLLTGLYPSESLVYHLQSNADVANRPVTLPHLLRDQGYVTGAFVTNPFAYYYTKLLEHDFDALPEPDFPAGKLQSIWHGTGLLHQDTLVGCRIDEYKDMEHAWAGLMRIPNNLSIRYRPRAAFEEARGIIRSLPEGFFLWVHVVTPHHPYLPDPADQNRFIPQAEVELFAEEFGDRWVPHYPPSQQSQVDRRRLAYDEFVATADRAFGDFMADLEASGRMENTTVIVSADHGESFEGGVFQHRSQYLTGPVVHVPLIIRRPGQETGRTVKVTADQSSLPPTLLQMSGLAVPSAMKSPSLVGWLDNDADGEGQGLAFTQYFDRSSVYKPVKLGSVGVIDSSFECVVYVNSQKCELRPLEEAQNWKVDRSSEFPQQTEALRQKLRERFPSLVN
jgi:arylsulfatase A-like enzyme